MIALIPARAGSKRIPGKNTKLLAGHPLIAYTIAAAQESGVFSEVVVATDALDVPWEGVTRFHRRPVPDDQPDIEWLAHFSATRPTSMDDCFAILRPTSPFRSAEHIRQAFTRFHGLGETIDSMRAVRKVKEHPGKMWYFDNLVPGLICPLAEPGHAFADVALTPDQPWHSSPTQLLPPYYVQTSSLEMAWTRVLHESGTISGTRIAPWIVDDWNGFALDTPDDWDTAERHAADGSWPLPTVDVARVSPTTPALR